MVDQQTQEDDLSDIIDGAMNADTGTKEAIKTLHPEDEESKDRLTILDDNEIHAHAVVEWLVRALKQKNQCNGYVIEGLSDKIKALKVSKQGLGRSEVGSIFKPQIMGEMMSQGMIPEQGMGMGMQPRRQGFMGRMFGRR